MSYAGGIMYAIILERENKFYVWYRNFDEHLEILEDRKLEPSIRTVLIEPSGIMELLDLQIKDWMIAHHIETIGGFNEPNNPPVINTEERILQLEHSVYVLANRLKRIIKESNMQAQAQNRRQQIAEENTRIAMGNLINKVLPLETVVACAIVNGGCQHIWDACDNLTGVVGAGMKNSIVNLVGN